MAGSVIIQGQLNSVPQGYTNIGPFVIAGNSANHYSQSEQTLPSGPTTIGVPAFANGVLIIPDPSNTVALTLKGVSGDTGIAISPSSPSLLSFPATAPVSFVVTAASLTTTVTTFTFF